MSGIYQIVKLEDNNYDSWSMRSVTVHSGLWSVTSGELTATNASEGVDWSTQNQKCSYPKVLNMITPNKSSSSQVGNSTRRSVAPTAYENC